MSAFITRRAAWILATTLLLPGCGDSESSGGESSEGGSQWKVTYSGALSGEISGGIVVVVAAGGFGSIAASGPEDSALQVGVDLAAGETGDSMLLPLSITLADGSSCTLADQPVNSTVSNGETDSYALDFAGPLECDAGRIEVDGLVRAG